MPLSPARRDTLAREYLEAKANLVAADLILQDIRAALLEEIEAHGATPPRACKMRMIAGERFEVRASFGSEITVETAAAERLIRLCGGALWKRLFRRVVTYTLAPGAQKLVNCETLPASAPRHLRALFARSINVKALAPQLEVRERAPEPPRVGQVAG